MNDMRAPITRKMLEADAVMKAEMPTYVTLDSHFVSELKKEAQIRGIPYQVLMRMLIVEGFKRLKKHTANHHF